MPAHRLIALAVLIALMTVACSSVGSGGTLTPRSPDSGTIAPVSPEPSADPASPEPSEAPVESEPPATVAPSPTPTSAPGGATSVKIYLFMDGKLVPVRRQVEETRAVGRAALNALFEGPTAEELAASPPLTTSIPDGTILLGLDIADGLATVDLSREFESGGGSASMFGRLAQVVYTLTQFPTVKQVAFQLDGEPVTVFSGEGIVLDEPSGREDYEAFLPSVFVERPTWGATIGNPVRVSGIANVFEAVFFVEVRDSRWRHACEGAGHGHVRHRVLGHVRRDDPIRRVGPAGRQCRDLHPVGGGRQHRGSAQLPGHARPVARFMRSG